VVRNAEPGLCVTARLPCGERAAEGEAASR
jgi:hypothetical protein